MASLKTTLVSNLDTVPAIMNEVGEAGGRVRACIGNVSWVGGTLTTNGDFMRICRLPSNARIVEATFYNETLDGGTTINMDLGLLPIDSDSSTSTHTASLNCISDGADGFQTETVGDAASGVDMTIVVAADIPNYGKKLHTLAGDTTDPGGHYDVVLVAAAAAGSDQTGNVAFRVLYTVD
mgnify:CR=1 FL=1